ncbi:MAG TPA: PP2C family serine/threonine-protein phosphatase [Quisquiliibacterium sp.]|nr:PP2C family serine/threonine-protein phosphatase [Quisquiliibacterium sp.]
MKFSIFQDSALGARQVNQDRMGYCFSRESLLMIVADGMGGHLRGEVAAQIAMQTAGAVFQRMARPALEDPIEFLDHALRSGHREILRYQELHRMPEAPRTTVVACLVQGGRAWWAHAGDSRLYWMRGGELLVRTRDHSKVESLVAQGLLQPHEQEQHPERNKVLNCLGSPFEPTVEISQGVELLPGDSLLLCSDGLWSALSDEILCRVMAAAPAMRAVPDLVRQAVAAAGRQSDNVTALGMNWEGADQVAGTLSSSLLPDGAVTTTIALGQLDAEAAPDLTEDEIERTIREIRSAIDRTAGR